MKPHDVSFLRISSFATGPARTFAAGYCPSDYTCNIYDGCDYDVDPPWTAVGAICEEDQYPFAGDDGESSAGGDEDELDEDELNEDEEEE